ncbi:hypothetical protein DRF59_19045 [Chryseobacterium flavum]|uniref:Uncharacterized protein n=1 Tax=Chryseobacterium flavum TaxID=415851 RepID=A0A3D9CGC0_9FLAO|nr:hypothetical protein [Chryseobacterium flavum]REC64796.1 hypothetical protein DRF59_19045 [Chryseobacterium flavum]
MKKIISNLFLITGILLSISVFGQIGIGSPVPRGALDINKKDGDKYSYDMGLVLPTNDTAAKIKNAVPNASVAPGTIFYDSTKDCIRLRQIPDWSDCLTAIETVPSGEVTTLVCGTPIISGTFAAEVNSYGTFTIKYTGANGKSYPTLNVESMSVTGLKATLAAGYFQTDGELTFVVSGIPAAAGNAIFVIIIGGKNCVVMVPVSAKPSIAALNPGRNFKAKRIPEDKILIIRKDKKNISI